MATGDVTADRAVVVALIVLITGMGAYAGVVAGVELGRTCDEGAASAALNALEAWGCID